MGMFVCQIGKMGLLLILCNCVGCYAFVFVLPDMVDRGNGVFWCQSGCRLVLTWGDALFLY